MIDQSGQRRLVSKGRSERILGDGGSGEGDAISASETGSPRNHAIPIPIKLSGFLPSPSSTMITPGRTNCENQIHPSRGRRVCGFPASGGGCFRMTHHPCVKPSVGIPYTAGEQASNRMQAFSSSPASSHTPGGGCGETGRRAGRLRAGSRLR